MNTKGGLGLGFIFAVLIIILIGWTGNIMYPPDKELPYSDGLEGKLHYTVYETHTVISINSICYEINSDVEGRIYFYCEEGEE